MESSSDEKKMSREPLLGTPSSSKGGFRAVPFIIANEAFERVASFGLTPNMILYLTKEYGMETIGAANVLFFWSAATNFTPIIGAFLADSYVGRYRMIGFGSIISLLGMVLLWFTTMFPQARPPPCYQFGSCKSPTASQLPLLYSSFILMSIGAGGIRASSLAFGADQLDRRNNPENAAIFQSFFSWYYASVIVSALVAVTCLVYIQDNLGWKVGFGVPALLMFMSAFSFFLASPFYVKLKAKPGLLTGFAQVLMASYRNRNIELSTEAADEAYHRGKGSTLLMPSEKLRFLNKACVIRNPQQDLTLEGRASDPWRLCTLDQVEGLKALIRVMPLWSTGIMVFVTLSQNSFVVLQAGSMDRHITPNVEIPAGSLGMFNFITLVSWVALYDFLILPLASKIKGKPVRLRLKQRMWIGILCSCASMVSIATVESVRRAIVIEEGLSGDPQAVVNLSAMWLLPHYVFNGLAEAFMAIGQTEFFYTELPKTMSSVASNLIGLAVSIASLLASFITSTVKDITERGDKKSWLSSNINNGHYDYYYWVLAGLCFVNLFYFLACSKAYGPCQGEDKDKILKGKDEICDELISTEIVP